MPANRNGIGTFEFVLDAPLRLLGENRIDVEDEVDLALALAYLDRTVDHVAQDDGALGAGRDNEADVSGSVTGGSTPR